MPRNTSSVQSKIKYFKANKHFISQNIDLQTKEPERAGDIIKGMGTDIERVLCITLVELRGDSLAFQSNCCDHTPNFAIKKTQKNWYFWSKNSIFSPIGLFHRPGCPFVILFRT